MKYRLFLFAAFLFLHVKGKAQLLTDLGRSGSSQSERFQMVPTSFSQARVQVLVTKTELANAGLTAGSLITGIAYYVITDNTPTTVTANWYADLTSAPVFQTANFAATPTARGSSSDAGTVHNDWRKVIFSSPITWDGSSNLIVQSCRTSPALGVSDMVGTKITSWGNSTITGYSHPCTEPSGFYVQNTRPQLALLSKTPFRISSFSPASGPAGTIVSVTGSGFSAIPSQNSVYFGNTPATVLSATANELVVQLSMAASGPLKVVNTATHLSVQSDKVFTTTFAGGVAPGMSIQTLFPKVNTKSGPDTNPDLHESYLGFRTVAGDFDGDGKIDAAIMGSVVNSTMIVYQNKVPAGKAITADGFVPAATLALEPGTYTAYSEDVNNDGRPDIVVGGIDGFTVYQNTSTGPADFSFSEINFPVSAPNASQKLIMADMDNDGMPDIVAVNPGSSATLSVYKNTTSGGDISFAAGVPILAPQTVGDLMAADLDNDGDKDLVISATAGSPFQSVYLIENSYANDGTISLSSPVIVYNELPEGGYNKMPVALAAGDLDNDGDIDIVSVSKTMTDSEQLLHIHRNDGQFNFTTFAAGNSTRSYNITFNVRLADVNGDGRTDILFGEQNTGGLSLVLNQYQSGTLAASDFADRSLMYLDVITGAGIEDFNNDGKLDIITSSYYTGSINLLGNGNLVILPVKFAAFTAQAQPQGVDLKWTTAHEQNSQWFEVERSADGKSFITIGRVAAAGNATTAIHYQFTDAAPLEGINYYRLRQVDTDGRSMYSSIRMVTLAQQGFSFNILQNPVSSMLKLNITLAKAERLKIEITNAAGTVLVSRDQSFAAGNNQYAIPVSHLPAGAYYVNVIKGNSSNAKVFVKQ